ncbi:hypothetical protein BJ508DRAFT_411052 [Ascobolus immersus RN42]|uniref:Uncharacterized protein n=1 Tax=Ascobolus immersus RN42 TaxID=1160509 RepID=A0A3N4INA1_ASCIM|nr:hypothetical protein BJ508DRAFT_411052 [Ascobolus immersus RN42]
MPADRRPTFHVANPGPYRSHYCSPRSSAPVAPWSNPRRSPYCPRDRSEDKHAYDVDIGTYEQQLEAERISENIFEAKESLLEDVVPARVRRTGQFGKFWINPNAKNKSIRDPHYYRFPDGLPKCGFWNCPHTNDKKKDRDVECMFREVPLDYDSRSKSDTTRGAGAVKRRYERRKAQRLAEQEMESSVGVLSYDDPVYDDAEHAT